MVKKLEQDLHRALKARNDVAVRTLRMAIAALRNAALDKKKELTEEESFEVLRRQVKLRREAAEEYRKGKAEERAAAEDDERRLLEAYLPAELTDEEIRKAVLEAIQQIGAASPRELGKVMGVLMPQLKGRADGARVRALAQEALQPAQGEGKA